MREDFSILTRLWRRSIASALRCRNEARIEKGRSGRLQFYLNCSSRNHAVGKDMIAKQIFAQGEAAREAGQLLSVLT
jgi:hypothetical protein